jgi:predicted HTH transcriptional regulator
MGLLSEAELKKLVKGGETTTVELKLAAPRAVDLAERLCGMANAKGGMVISGVEDATQKVVGSLMIVLGKPSMSFCGLLGR